ncbi:thioredoxin family protein [Emticicia sp.]|uniref:thioredoxin family protein n=1 Tax=Emticicia sp. TaxID=1930953 RepID=UPI0037525E0F
MKKQILIVGAVLVVGGVFSTYFFKKVDAAQLKKSPTVKTSEALGYNIGDVIADFKLKNINGRMVSLSEFASAKGFIVIFTSNHCPFSKSYEDRVIALDNKYASQGFPVIGINPNDPEAYEEDSFANMQARAKEKGYTYPYLADDTQTVSKMFGAMRTPQVYVLKKEGGKIVVHYLGAIDDNAQDPSGVTKRYVEDAVNNLLTGKPVVTTITKAVGCAIKWKS